MAALKFRAKRTVTCVVCLLVLFALSGTIHLKGLISLISAGTWAPAGNGGSSMSSPRSGAATVLLQDSRLLIIGGNDGHGAVASVDLYDTSGNFSAAASMNFARSQHTATVLFDGTVLVAGGVDGTGTATSTAEIYNPSTKTWTAAGSLTYARSGHTASLLQDGTVLIAGGDNAGTAQNSLEIYNPASGTFSAAAGSLSSPRELHAAAVLQSGQVMIVGGFDGTRALATSDIYDPSTASVSGGPAMSTPRQNLSATAQLDGKVVVAGGNNGSANGKQDLASAEVYDPTAGTFTLTGSLSTARQGHQAFLLPHNGGILIVGGTSPVSGVETAISSVELYYPQASGEDASPNWNGTFNITGSMASARSGTSGGSPSNGTPQSQNDGLLLIAGGKDATGTPLSNGELYGFAWVKSDALDYAPGTTVNISGGGWQPGETVTLHLQESPYYDSHPDLTATVQADGTFSNSQFSPDSHDVGIRFYLTVTGSASGLQAQTTFTDNNITVASAPSGITFTLNWISYKGSNCTGTVNTNGSNAITSGGANIGIGNPASVSLEAPSLSDQGGSFTKWTLPGGSTQTTATICVNNPSGTYTATYSTTAVAPTLSSVSPGSSDLGTTVTETLTGTNFVAASTVAVSGSGVTAGTPTINSSNSMSVPLTITSTAATLGTHNVTVINPGSGGGSAASNAETFTVDKRTTSTSVSCTPGSAGVGSATTCTATVKDTDSGTASTPAGSVSFTSSGSGAFSASGSCTLSGSGTTATCNLTYTPAAVGTGTHTITASYGGDTTHANTNGSFNLTVNQATTTTAVTSSANPSTFGQSVTFTATVSSNSSPITSGSGDTVTFKDGTATLGTGTLNGAGLATFTTNTLSGGSHSITAVYAGDTSYAASTSSALSQTVNTVSTSTAVVSSLNPSTYNQSVTFTATVSSNGNPITLGSGETVTFKDGTTTLGTGTLNASGVATYSTSTLSGGSHSITAVYGGDTNYATSTSGALSQTVNQASTSTSVVSSLNPSTYGQSITFTATVSSNGNPITSGTGDTVTFKDGANTLGTGTLNASGTATYSTSTLSGAAHSITAVYGGDTNYVTSTSGVLSQTVNQASTSTTLASSLNPSAYGQPVTFTATVSVPGGTPTGTVTFKDGSTTLGTGTLSGNTATYTAAATQLAVGPHSVTAVYGGDTNYAGSTSGALSQTVNKASTTTLLTVSPSSITVGQSATVTATVSPQYAGTPGGTLSVSDGLTGTGNTCTITLSNGTGQCSLTPTSNGSLTVSGAYGGDSNFTTSNGATSLTVTGTPPQITSGASTALTAGMAGSFMVTATGTPTPTLSESGSLPSGVTFKDNGNGTATLAGTATAAGTSLITITAHNGVGTDATQFFTLTVNPASLASITLSPANVTITAGGSQAYTATGYDQYQNRIGDVTSATTFSVSNGACTANACSSTVAGAQTVTGNDSGITSMVTLNVLPGAITQLALTPATATIAAGASQTYAAQGLDTYGNPAGDVTASTTFTMTSPGSCTGASCTSNAAAAYTVTGTYTNGAQGTASLTVTAGSFTQLQLLVPGETAAPGTATGKTGTPNTEYVNGAFNLTVNAVDQYWNLVNSVTDTVQITSSDAHAALPANAALVAGTGTFSVTPETVSYNPAITTVTAADDSDNTKTSSTSPAITVIVVYTANITPTQAATGQPTVYTLNLTNAPAPNTNRLRSVRVAIPTNGGLPSNISVLAIQQDSTPASWLVDQSQSDPGYLRVRECVSGDSCYVSSSNDIAPGGVISIQFTTTANETVSTAPVQEVWTTTAFSDSMWTSSLPLAPPEPTVAIGAAPSFTSAATATFTYSTAGTFKVTANGVPVPALSESGSLPSGVTFTDNGDGTATITGTPGAAGSYPITLTAHNGYGSDATQTFMLAVNKAMLTPSIVASNKIYDGTASATVTCSLTGVIGTDNVTCSAASANFSQAGAGTGLTVTATGITLSGTAAANYSLSSATATTTANITPKPLTASIAASNKVYDGTASASVTCSLTGVIGTDNVACSAASANFSQAGAGTGLTVTATGITLSGTAAANYSLSSATATTTANITPKPLTASIAASNKVYDGTASASVTCSLTGVIGTDNVNCSAASANFSQAGAGTGLTVTATGITLGGTAAANYSLSSATATTTANITPKPLTASIVASNKVYDGTASATVTCGLTGVVGTDNVTCSTASANFSQAGTGTGLTVTATGITLSGTAAANYSLSSATATTTADITPKPLTASIVASNKVYDGTASASVTCSLTGVVGTDNVACSAASANFSQAGAGTGLTVTATGITLSGTAAANYSLSSPTATTTANITPKPLTANIAASNKIYDGTASASVTCSLTGVVGTDNVTCSTASANFSQAGAGNGPHRDRHRYHSQRNRGGQLLTLHAHGHHHCGHHASPACNHGQ